MLENSAFEVVGQRKVAFSAIKEIKQHFPDSRKYLINCLTINVSYDVIYMRQQHNLLYLNGLNPIVGSQYLLRVYILWYFMFFLCTLCMDL